MNNVNASPPTLTDDLTPAGGGDVLVVYRVVLLSPYLGINPGSIPSLFSAQHVRIRITGLAVDDGRNILTVLAL